MNPNENTQAEIYANIRDKALEEAAKLVEYRGQCAVQMINSEERLVEKKSYAWDALQHGIAIRALKRNPNG